MRRRLSSFGLSLAEMLVCMTIFALLTGLCFYVAVSGFRIFNQASGRQALQRDARATFSWLQRDIGLSNLVRCTVSPHSAGGTSKDTLALAGLSSWQQPVPVDALGLPSWNTVIVYKVNADGALSRYGHDASDLGLAVPLQAADVRQTLQQAESGSAPFRDRRQLTPSVRSFSVSLDESRNVAVVDLLLQTATVGSGVTHTRQEVLQLQTTITAKNTWPRH